MANTETSAAYLKLTDKELKGQTATVKDCCAAFDICTGTITIVFGAIVTAFIVYATLVAI